MANPGSPGRRGALRRSRLSPAARRRAILAGARQALLRHGIQGTTMDDVAAAAGVAKGTPYLYFPSKAELLAALRLEYDTEMAERARRLLQASPDVGPGSQRLDASADAGLAVPRLEALAASMFEFAVEHRDLHHVLFHDAGGAAQEQLGPVTDALASFLAAGMASGWLRPGDPAFLAGVLVAGVHAAMLPSLHQEQPDREAFLALARDLIGRLFGTGPE